MLFHDLVIIGCVLKRGAGELEYERWSFVEEGLEIAASPSIVAKVEDLVHEEGQRVWLIGSDVGGVKDKGIRAKG